MKPILNIFLSLLCLLGASAQAEKADTKMKTEVLADKMTYDDVKQVNSFTGNVVLTRGTLLMKADRVVVTQDPEGYQFATLYAAPGGLATFRQKRDGGDFWVEGQAERIEYDGKAELVKLFSKSKLTRLEGTKPSDEVEGEFISYDSHTEFFTVTNTASGDGKTGGGRVKAVLQPRGETKPAEIKPDSKLDTKADTKVDTKVDTKADTKVDTKADAKTDPKDAKGDKK